MNEEPATNPAIVLVQPRMPQNVGAVGRLCAATRTELHIVRPIPFALTDRSLRRAGMDYLDFLTWKDHNDWERLENEFQDRRLWFLTRFSSNNLFETRFEPGDALVFGSEEAGLPESLRDRFQGRDLRIPMPEPRARCLNLATSAAVALYELLRQTGKV